MEWITAAATIVLAVTAWLAYRSNRDLIVASQAQAESARASLDRQREPRLVPADPECNRVGDLIETDTGAQVFRTRRVYLGLENAGPGVAFISKADVSSNRRGTFNVWWPPAMPTAVERMLKLTPHGGSVLDPPAGETFKVSIEYHGADEIQRWLRFTAQVFPDNEWVIHLVSTEP